MTIKLLAPYGKYRCNDIVTLDATTEAALIAAGQATATLTGGTTWVDINADDAPSALTDAEEAWVRSSVSGGLRRTALTPYRMATYGDSRGNLSVGDVATSSAGPLAERSATQLMLLRGDMRLVFNGGISGDTAANYNSASRTSSTQDLAACIAATPDIVLMQYGINDCIAGTAAATITANLQAAASEFMAAGIFVLFEGIYPCAVGPATYINGYASSGGYSSTSTQAEADAELLITQTVNNSMQAWLATFPGRAVFVPNTSATAGANGFAKTDQTYYDGTHLSAIGARAVARLDTAAIEQYFPLLDGVPVGGSYRNAVNGGWLTVSSGRASGVNAIVNELGTCTATYQVTTDADGEAVQEVVLTPTALGSGAWRANIQIAPLTAIGAGSSIAWAAADVLQGFLDMTIDDGAGGAPSCFNVQVRPRIYYNDATNEYVEMGSIQQQGSTDHPRYSQAERLRFLSPRRAVKAAMSSSTMLNTGSTVTALHVIVCGNVLTTPTRLRFKRGVWRKVA